MTSMDALVTSVAASLKLRIIDRPETGTIIELGTQKVFTEPENTTDSRGTSANADPVMK
jgi:hypothetical protein